MAQTSLTPLHIVSRIAAGAFGGYAFTWGFIALGMAGLFALGMPFHDTEALGYILGFLLFMVMFLWAFAAASLTRVSSVKKVRGPSGDSTRTR